MPGALLGDVADDGIQIDVVAVELAHLGREPRRLLRLDRLLQALQRQRILGRQAVRLREIRLGERFSPAPSSSCACSAPRDNPIPDTACPCRSPARHPVVVLGALQRRVREPALVAVAGDFHASAAPSLLVAAVRVLRDCSCSSPSPRFPASRPRRPPASAAVAGPAGLRDAPSARHSARAPADRRRGTPRGRSRAAIRPARTTRSRCETRRRWSRPASSNGARRGVERGRFAVRYSERAPRDAGDRQPES